MTIATRRLDRDFGVWLCSSVMPNAAVRLAMSRQFAPGQQDQFGHERVPVRASRVSEPRLEVLVTVGLDLSFQRPTEGWLQTLTTAASKNVA